MMNARGVRRAAIYVAAIVVSTWLTMTGTVSLAATDAPSVAFYYGSDVPAHMLAQFDWAVVEPANMSAQQLTDLQKYGTTAFAYVSVGESDRWRNDSSVPRAAIVTQNKNWNSDVVDLTNPAWSNYLIDERMRPLWNAGYHAFFLDTLDSYRLFAKDDAAAKAQQTALVALIKRIHTTFPGVKLLLNRGFEVLDQVHDDIAGVAAESLYKGWNPESNSYVDVSDADRAYVLNNLKTVADQYHLPAIAIDYLAPGQRDAARADARQIAADGIVPWVTDHSLDEMGVGSIEAMPRKVLVIYDKRQADSGMYAYSNVHLYAVMPLEYLGYGAVYQDVNSPLPSDTLRGRYAGVVSWLDGQVASESTYRTWLLKQMDDGVKVAMLGDPGLSITGEMIKHIGATYTSSTTDNGLAVVDHSDMVGFEGMPEQPASTESGFNITDSADTAQLTVRDGTGATFSPVITGPWGGAALSPWITQPGLGDQARWILDPFKFLKTALDLPDIPVPDATTENGSRYRITEVDGDAFVSRANFPGSPFTSEVLLNQIFNKYRVPTTVSVIQGEVGPTGLYPKLVTLVDPIARRIFSLPWVEIGTHTYSHPFDWEHLKEGDLSGEGKTAAGYGYNLPIQGYHYSTAKEVIGSTDWINANLAPPGKKVKVILWSGDALPPEKAIAMADSIGIANINGGNTAVTTDNPSLTNVSPMLRPFGDHIQVYAPVINENVYTNDMKGPLWGFSRVIETYKITDSPRRLKPIDTYYHFYSAATPAALNALKKVYDWVDTQQTLPVYASQYSDIARDWYDVGVATRLDGGWQITGATDMRTLRLPADLGWPDMAGSSQVAGVRDMPQGRYVALSGAPRAVLRVAANAPSTPYVLRSNGRITQWQGDGNGLDLRVQAEVVPLTLELGGTSGCSVNAPGARRTTVSTGLQLSYGSSDSGPIRITCGR